ncbi:sigma-70 family RNA polymerase sigma factor [Tumebacillus lipolyticus]|uniref:Sigma-70 family RNA polymerase sigma factor n=1 Tax=Tumebacillus lipolyticus TaxID=1280370 RepID=A0ABW4ZVA7_9BACL
MTDSLLAASRELRNQFEQVIEQYRTDLWRYCKMLTGSPWDGEDLFQETMLKAFASLAQLWHPLVPKAYLFRIASNAWIDQCRKNKLQLDDSEEPELTAPEQPDTLEVKEALESLIQQLPPKQLVVFLLIEVFQFTAPEVAGMIHATVGSVYATLHRARANVKLLQQDGQTAATATSASGDRKAIVEQIIHALNTGDLTGMLPLMSEQMHSDAAPGFQEYNKDDMYSGSMKGFAELSLQATLRTLWGREVIVVLAQTEGDQWQLHDISLQQFDDGKLVLHKSYYFCKELLLAAGQELQVPVQMNKPAVTWEVGEGSAFPSK